MQINKSENHIPINNKIISDLSKILSQQQYNNNKLKLYYISFQIRIKDSGKGILEENFHKLFHNFGMLADEEGHNKQGTGLGLSICKNIIEKMGGEVKVESEGLGHGTCFII